MIPPLPPSLRSLYAPLGSRVEWYARLRWRLCPFERVAQCVPSRGTIVDLACGYGLGANWMALASEERKLLGVDLSARRIAVARQTIGARRNIDFVCSDLRRFACPRCDAITIMDALHHMPFDVQDCVLRSAFASLRPQGLLIVLEAHRNWWWWKYWCVYGIDHALNWGAGIYHSSVTELMARMRDSGFELSAQRVDQGLPLPDFLLVGRKHE